MSDTSESSEFDDAVSAYLKFKEAESGKATYIRDVRQRLTNIGGKCGFRLMADITHERLSAWFMEISELDPKTRRSKLAPVTRINYRKTFSGFMTWCIRMGRMNGPNPVEKLPQPRIKGDFRRPRRAMTHEELLRVLKVALIKPMAEYARRRVSRTVNTKESWAECEVTADNIDVYANEAAGLLWQQPHYLKKLQRDGR